MRVRGSLIATLPKIIRKKFGDDGHEKWITKISPEARELFLNSIDSKEWYSLKKMLLEPFANVAQVFYDWDIKAAAWEFGRAGADIRFWGPSKALMKIPSPGFFVNKGFDYLKTYYDPCRVELVENEKNRCVQRVVEFPEPSSTVDYRVCGWVQRGLEICGCKDVQVEISKSLVNLDPYTEFIVTWK
jgi:hypothetical protein